MREVSLVGSKGEEAGANFSEYNRLLETKIPLLQHILPWGAMSVIKDAKQSDDGPIWWVRPGEQSIPCAAPSTPSKSLVGYKRARNSREKEVEDRTYPHLDHVDNPRQTTHAVGVLKAVKIGRHFSG